MMAKLEKSLRREKKINKRKYGMRRDGDSAKLLQKELEKRASKIRKKNRKRKGVNYEGFYKKGI